jgi:hypothetical protein
VEKDDLTGGHPAGHALGKVLKHCVGFDLSYNMGTQTVEDYCTVDSKRKKKKIEDLCTACILVILAKPGAINWEFTRRVMVIVSTTENAACSRQIEVYLREINSSSSMRRRTIKVTITKKITTC